MKKGVSPLIATVLLVALTVITITSVGLWAKNLQSSYFGFAEEQAARLSLFQDISYDIPSIQQNKQIESSLDGSILDVVIDNFSPVPFTGFIIHPYDSNNELMPSTEAVYTVPAYESKVIRVAVPEGATKAEIIPVIKDYDGQQVAVKESAFKVKIPEIIALEEEAQQIGIGQL